MGQDLAGVIGDRVTRPEGVQDGDVQVRDVEAAVVVASVPQDDIRRRLGLREDGTVVHSREDQVAIVDMGFVLLALLDGGLVEVQVAVGLEPLDRLLLQITVWHGVTYDGNTLAHLLDDRRHRAGGLGFARSRSGGADGDDGPLRPDGRLPMAQEHEAGPCRDGARCQMHHRFVTQVRVGQYHHVHVLGHDHLFKFLLELDGDPLWVQIASERGWIGPVIDVRDLCRGECDHIVLLAIAEENVEIVEISTGRSHDYDALALQGNSLLGVGSIELRR